MKALDKEITGRPTENEPLQVTFSEPINKRSMLWNIFLQIGETDDAIFAGHYFIEVYQAKKLDFDRLNYFIVNPHFATYSFP